MLEPSNIDKIVFDRLENVSPTPRVLNNLGWTWGQNPGVKYRPKHLCSFNYATQVDEIDYISQFIRGADVDTVRSFYRETNGMRLFFDKFSVPGVLFHREDFVDGDFNCVALDFSNHGGVKLPKFAPEEGFLIGESQRKIDGNWCRLYDILTKSGEVVGGFFDESSHVSDLFEMTSEWLVKRVDAAAQEFKCEVASYLKG